MRVYPFLQIRALCGGANQLAQVLLRVGFAAAQTDEQPIFRLARTFAHVLGQNRHARRGNVRVAILLRFRGLDVQGLAAQVSGYFAAFAAFAKLRSVSQNGVTGTNALAVG